ncbi:MAG: M48 family metallopeptidase [Candidatus Aureabacteria bacterium]|nr:M48 family metallopeptidase [Candidatus Auribacterota bacterium]
MNLYLFIILFVLIGEYILDVVVNILNVHAASPFLPSEFEGYYDAEKYRKSQAYLRDNTFFGLAKEGLITTAVVVFMLAGGFQYVDNLARRWTQGSIEAGLVFAGLLVLFSQVLSLPFSAYRTFVIEEKYGFNRTTLKTFFTDILKSWVLIVVLGGFVFACVIWFFESFGFFAWLYCWIGTTLFQLFIVFIAPVTIMPLFNRFIPLEDGELKTSIEEYARSQKFKMKGVFKMDASRRSSKSNAFFAGFGRFRRIALFDTLIEKHSVDELVSVLAHEIGHYKKKHVLKGIILSILTTGFMFFILSFFIGNRGLFDAFRMKETSVYASLVFFGFLFTPINFIFSIFSHVLSRKYEYEADAFAVETYGRKDAFIEALKKLSVDNLSNLTPHRLKVFIEYTHPPVLKRIESIRSLSRKPGEGS